MRAAVVRERSGSYWQDLAIIRFERNGKVDCPDMYEPNETEAKDMEAEFRGVEFPSHVIVQEPTHWPEEIVRLREEGRGEEIFELRNTKGEFVMAQVRRELPTDNPNDDNRIYFPWTLWDDGEWRGMEPEGKLPLWGMEFIKGSTTVFIHEGAKAARAMNRMVRADTPQMKKKLKEHPWGEEMATGCHVGWIGGALSPQRTDWSALKKAGIKRAYIISDNDPTGVRSVPNISFNLHMPTFSVTFTSKFPGSFDMADEFPDDMFADFVGMRTYKGPTMRECMGPATWATDMIPNKHGKPSAALRDHFKEMWAYVEEADLFVCTAMPEIVRVEPILNKLLAPFSHVNETSKLIVKAYTGRIVKIAYRPDVGGGTVTDKGRHAINLHTPSSMKSVKGDATPWKDFLSYLIPKEVERVEMERWIATLIARPETKMEYGMLLFSEKQGVGKTTLGAVTLAPIIGMHNVGFPSEGSISNAGFNDWLVHKRLVICNEIYAGHNFKAYNILKSYVTDREVEVNIKYQRPYIIENWAHIFACSNSRKALKLEDEDRRWFYPEVTEDLWGKERFTHFHRWLRSGGHSIVKYWAEAYGDYVLHGAAAPMTDRKREMIEESYSKAIREVMDFGRQFEEWGPPSAVGIKSIDAWVRSCLQGEHHHESDHDLKKAMMRAGGGLREWKERVYVDGRLQFVLLNPSGFKVMEGMSEEAVAVRNEKLRSLVISPNTVCPRVL